MHSCSCFFQAAPSNVTLALTASHSQRYSSTTSSDPLKFLARGDAQCRSNHLNYWRPVMKRHFLLIPLIFATTAAIADTQTIAPSADAQAQAAALLSPPHAVGAPKAEARSPSRSSVSAALDAQESAAALLSGVRPGNRVTAVSASAERSRSHASADAQAQAAALLRGSRTSSESQTPANQANQANGDARTIGIAF
jgi:hypothetical protein